MIKRQNHD